MSFARLAGNRPISREAPFLMCGRFFSAFPLYTRPGKESSFCITPPIFALHRLRSADKSPQWRAARLAARRRFGAAARGGAGMRQYAGELMRKNAREKERGGAMRPNGRQRQKMPPCRRRRPNLFCVVLTQTGFSREEPFRPAPMIAAARDVPEGVHHLQRLRYNQNNEKRCPNT